MKLTPKHTVNHQIGLPAWLTVAGVFDTICIPWEAVLGTNEIVIHWVGNDDLLHEMVLARTCLYNWRLGMRYILNCVIFRWEVSSQTVLS